MSATKVRLEDGTWAYVAVGATGPPGPAGADGTDGTDGADATLTGPAGGDLTGTYPNPQIGAAVITHAEIAAANKDGAAAVPSMRTIGTGALQALAGNTDLSTIAAPTSNVAMNNKKHTNLATPTADGDAANKLYVDSTVGGVSWKDSVRLATTGNHSLSGLSTIDGVTPSVGDRILVKSQTAPAQNGIFVAASGGWVRAFDMDAAAEFPSSTVMVEQGTVNADTCWRMTTDAPISVNVTGLTWAAWPPDPRVVGEISMFAGTTVPTRWLLCDGRSTGISRTTYAALFAVIGTTYGTGDGSSTFNLPDAKNRFPRGAGTEGAAGDTDGKAEASRTTVHDHPAGELVNSAVSHNGATNTAIGGTALRVATIAGDEDGTHNHTITGTTGNSLSADMPHITFNVIIYAGV